jgi:hypothetical protein
MTPKSELRHGSFYLYKGDLIKYDVEGKYNLVFTDNYVMSFEKIKITDEIFDLIKASIREILDESFQNGVYASIILPENYKYYVLIVNQTKIKDLYYLHEVQNLISELYDKELQINDKRLSDLIKLARV